MPQGRGTVTDQLINVIQVIQLGRKTGVLTVERGEEETRQEGEIVFVSGQITEAYCGKLSGQKALSWLCTWGLCRFNFVPSERTTRPLPALPKAPTTQTNLYTGQDTNPQSRIPTTPFPPIGENGQKDQSGSTTGPLSASTNAGNAYSPRRILQDDEALRLLEHSKLSRTHRHLFLLIDGRRSMGELVRVMGRSQEEVQRMLYDLARIGVIQQ